MSPFGGLLGALHGDGGGSGRFSACSRSIRTIRPPAVCLLAWLLACLSNGICRQVLLQSSMQQRAEHASKWCSPSSSTDAKHIIILKKSRC